MLEGGTLITAAVVVTLMSGCTTLPVTIAVGIAGGTMMVCGVGNLTQGSMNVYYGSIGDLTSVAVNPVCEVFFGGNEKNFDTFCYYNMMFLTMYMMAGAGSVSGMVVEGVQEGAGDITSTYVTSYLSSTCNLSDFESVLIGTTTNFLIDPGLDAIGSHSLYGGTHFSHLNNYTNGTPNINPHLYANQLDLDTNMHILNGATDINPNTLINGNGVELPNHLCNDGVGVGSEWGSNVWDMTEGGGIINGREYSQHAMERMAPDTPSVRADLSRRAEALAESKGLQVGTPEYYQFCQKYVDPRNIPPSVIEDAIRNTNAVPGHTAGTFVHQTADVTVIVNEIGKVITVIPK